jgi:hypothetical protein
MAKIYLKCVQMDLGNGMEYCLEMSDSEGTGINDLHTVVKSKDKVSWILKGDSGIKGISRIWVTDTKPNGKIFKKEPKKAFLTSSFQVDAIDTQTEIEEKYFIKFITANGTTVEIDPYLRVDPI